MQAPSLEEWIRDTFARRDEVFTRVQAEAQMATVLQRYREDSEHKDARIADLEQWRSNLLGRGVALAFIGVILTAVCASVITRLIFG